MNLTGLERSLIDDSYNNDEVSRAANIIVENYGERALEYAKALDMASGGTKFSKEVLILVTKIPEDPDSH